ncbi:hypothetical protein MKZ38_007306 [Zalerion maritima]|uniref:Protein kinase domain-containing protein n=1 Tax=Zalerion maritima TaxID=339359 RepID=A0AAD5RHY6_9PEZI|nr:hypothetical protein MKZ38_007306 [Zalerion maritima]
MAPTIQAAPRVVSFAPDPNRRTIAQPHSANPSADPLSPRITNRGWDQRWPDLIPGPGSANDPDDLEDVVEKLKIHTVNVSTTDQRDNNVFFFNPSSINSIFNHATLVEIIKEAKPKIVQPGIQQRIYAGNFQRVLGILAHLGRLPLIGEFAAVGLDDTHLPIVCQKERDDTLVVVSCRHPKICFDMSKCKRKAPIHKFIGAQYHFLTPYLYQPNKQIPHYVFEKDEALPFLLKEALDPNGNDDDDDSEIVNVDDAVGGDTQTRILGGGGFADVFKVVVHGDFYNFGDVPLRHKDKSFAMKQLRQNHFNMFCREVEVLKRLSGRHEHLIPLIMTFEQDVNGGAYHFLFPWASGDLRTLWTRQNASVYHCRWLISQCFGLADALAEVHCDKENNEDPDDPSMQAKKYARHGDIKPDNVLLFDEYEGIEKHGPKLILADFGFGRFHRQWSRSTRDPAKTPKSPTYRAPEFELKNSNMTRRSDIWSLGCTFLELATWFLFGQDAVENRLRKKRDGPDIFGRQDERVAADSYFQVNTNQTAGRLKAGVTEWFGQLHDSRKCPRAIHDLLAFVETRMLEIQQKQRAGSRDVAQFLKRKLEEHPKANSNYWTKAVDCHCPRPRPVIFREERA